jgi:hypothetical protein
MPAETLLELLRKQREVLARLKELADHQQSLVIDADPQPLLNLLAERQRLVDRLGQISGRLAPYRQQWPEFVASLPDDDRRRAEDILGEINDMLTSVLASDERDTQLLTSRRNMLAEEMSSTQTGQRATQAYQCRPQGPSVLNTTDLDA